MSMLKKLTAVLLVGGAVTAGYFMLPAKGVQNRKMFVDLHPIRHDSFAEHLHRKITDVARLTTARPRPVIFDSDAAQDDALALILIGNDPSISLQAITIAGTGQAHALPGAENMAAIARLIGRSQVPLAYGRELPLSPKGVPFPAQVRIQTDKLLASTSLKPRKDANIQANAVMLMQQVLFTSHDKVTILATGPLTNVAELLQKNPQLKTRIEKIVIMGGAVKVPGNIDALLPDSKNKVSEWNFYADPQAVKSVFASGVPITLVTLDATRQVPVTKKFFEALSVEDQPDLKLARQLVKTWEGAREVYLWDALAAMVMLDPSVAKLELMPLIVDPANGSLKMAKLHQRSAKNIKVVTQVLHPDFILTNLVAMVKSNHIFAEQKFYHDVSRDTAKNLNRKFSYAQGV